ncbi:MAG: PfkB family carbohydrate kinase [Candidatus Omnitrophica bacterium]|nr:PfkB family carbohydrate kinase [Candidatus Omnitrophota bacterium]
MSIIVLGTVALDTVKTPFGLRKEMLGGSAVHFAMSARLFTRVNLVAVIGENFPRRHLDFLKQKGLVLTSLRCVSGKTFQWEGRYEGDLNTAFTLKTELGVLCDFKPVISSQQRKIKNIFLANVDPQAQKSLLRSMHSPRLVGLDSMNYWIKNKRKALLSLLKEVDIYVANDQEARDLSGETNLVKAAKCLRSFGPPMVLIKKGEHGVLFYCDKFIFSLPAYPTEKVVDPTGAGDTFAGGFMGYLSKINRISQESIQKAIAYGTIAASFNVEGFGADKTSAITMKNIHKRLLEFRKLILFK